LIFEYNNNNNNCCFFTHGRHIPEGVEKLMERLEWN